MPRKKKDEVTPAVENTVEAVSAETTATTAAEAPAEKPKRGRRKKADVERLLQRRLFATPAQRRQQKAQPQSLLLKKSKRLLPGSPAKKPLSPTLSSRITPKTASHTPLS